MIEILRNKWYDVKKDRNLVKYMKKEKLFDIHIYHNKLEYFIKLVIWWACWIGGVWMLWGKTEGVSSAFFVFALSQLMEFAPMLLKKKYTAGQLCHGLFCIDITAVLLISIALLLSKAYDVLCHTIMNVLVLVSLAYMTVDWFILLLSKDPTQRDNGHSETQADVEAALKKYFTEHLLAGSLGDVEKGN